MQAGKLRQRVTLQSATASQDDFGEETYSWSDLATVWAAVEPLAGREYMDAKQLKADISTLIRIRWRADVNESLRVTWTDPGEVAHVYDIDTVIADTTHQRELALMCSEVVS